MGWEAFASMLPGLGGLASGAATAYSGYKNYKAQQETNLANLFMNWQNNQANKALTEGQWARDDTAVQRRVADLKAAGLNPVLAAGQGAQSSAPISMQAGSVQAPQMPDMGSAISKGISTYGALIQARELRAREKAQTELAQAQLLNARLQGNLLRTENQKLDESRTLQMMDTNLRAQELRDKTHNNDYYMRAGLPSNSQGSEAARIMQMRSVIKTLLLQAKSKGIVVDQSLLDMFGGD
nr:MAG: DNA pilot protein [Microvirus sp.]